MVGLDKRVGWSVNTEQVGAKDIAIPFSKRRDVVPLNLYDGHGNV